MTGLETAVWVYFTELVGKHNFDGFKSLIDLCVINPRKIMHLQVPEIKENAEAEMSIINPGLEWTVNVDEFYSLSVNSCFIGKKLIGKVMGTIGNRESS